MSEGRTAADAAHRDGSGPIRLVRAWRVLPYESRLAAGAALALFLTLFLPWYQVTLIAPAKAAKLESASATITGWGAFSFVEAAVLLIAAAVLTLLFHRAEGRAFHLPGGDGGVITAAGLWTCLLIVWRIFDKQGATTHGPSATSSGVEWGIFMALAAAAFLAYSGSRIRAAHRPEPPLPGEEGAPAGSSAAAPTRPASRRRDSPPPPRGRVRRPAPVPADPPDWAAPSAPRPAASSAPSDRPRRRASAAELFEHVTFEDPPTMRLARSKRPSSGDPPPADEHPTDPLEDREDATLALGQDATLALGEDATLALGQDATLPMRDDATLRLGRDATLPLGEDATLPLGEDATLPLDDRSNRH